MPVLILLSDISKNSKKKKKKKKKNKQIKRIRKRNDDYYIISSTVRKMGLFPLLHL
jgi:hypothetical protein